MSGGGHAHVENAIWMRSLLMAGIFLTIGVVAYGVLVGGGSRRWRAEPCRQWGVHRQS